jgi:phosphoglycerate kinase
MTRDILNLDDFDFQGKTVLLRVDINSPIDPQTKRIKDDTRIKRSLPTIEELSGKAAKVVILAHQGDPLDYQNFTTLEEHAQILARLLGQEVTYIDDVVGPAAREMIRALEEGQILLLENIRIHTEETIIFEEMVKLSPRRQTDTLLVRKLAPLADIYVCDAFAAAHRSEPSLVGFPEILPSACGRLFQEELRVLEQIRDHPKRPCLFLLGGAKILDAFKMMGRVLEEGSADHILTGGLVGQVMLRAAGYPLGKLSDRCLEERNLDQFVGLARDLLREHGEKVLCPQDVAVEGDGRREIDITSLPAEGLIMDIGKRTIETYTRLIAEAGTIFVNGPLGIYEREEAGFGTRSLWEAIADSQAFSVIGGGDTITAAKRFGVQDKVSYICTAGGGLIRFLSGEKLAVVEALRKAARRQR